MEEVECCNVNCSLGVLLDRDFGGFSCLVTNSRWRSFFYMFLLDCNLGRFSELLIHYFLSCV